MEGDGGISSFSIPFLFVFFLKSVQWGFYVSLERKNVRSLLQKEEADKKLLNLISFLDGWRFLVNSYIVYGSFFAFNKVSFPIW